ncbi:MAG: hypothetical protein HYZ26_09805 [Chloroflexi bacterium]|nr:hypothetical protein [Chloroflexota bacterium]
MSDQIPVVKGQPLSEADERLNAIFDEMQKKQIEYLDEAGKRIIDRSAALMTVIFAVTALGKDFPPPYLAAPQAKWLAVGVLFLSILSMLLGLFTVQPRKYFVKERSLTDKRNTLKDILDRKAATMMVGGWLFFIACILLAVLVGALILGS